MGKTFFSCEKESFPHTPFKEKQLWDIDSSYTIPNLLFLGRHGNPSFHMKRRVSALNNQPQQKALYNHSLTGCKELFRKYF